MCVGQKAILLSLLPPSTVWVRGIERMSSGLGQAPWLTDTSGWPSFVAILMSIKSPSGFMCQMQGCHQKRLNSQKYKWLALSDNFHEWEHGSDFVTNRVPNPSAQLPSSTVAFRRTPTHMSLHPIVLSAQQVPQAKWPLDLSEEETEVLPGYWIGYTPGVKKASPGPLLCLSGPYLSSDLGSIQKPFS